MVIKQSFFEDPFSVGSEGLVQDKYLKGSYKKDIFRPRARGLSDFELVSSAKRFSNEIRYKPGGNLEQIVHKLNGKIWPTEFWDFGKGPKGSIWVQANSQFIVWTSKGDSAAVERFTIAHELGHYVLHFRDNPKRPDGRHMMAGRYDNGNAEREANIFAINFLIPIQFITKLKKDGLSIKEIASIAKVDSYLVEAQLEYYGKHGKK
ncbi:MAG: ImmA/IrrE family metallo-endopeptidase [Sulfitobacter sp.]